MCLESSHFLSLKLYDQPLYPVMLSYAVLMPLRIKAVVQSPFFPTEIIIIHHVSILTNLLTAASISYM